jgi:hypothetical protein
MTDHWISDQTTKRVAPVGLPRPVPCAAWAIETIVPPGAKSFEWNFVRLLDNRADEGENCAGYGKALKRGKATTWVDCREAHDLYPGTDGGGLYVDELDYMGARDRFTTGSAVHCVIGRASETPLRDPNDNSVAHLDTFFRLLPYVPDWGKVKINYFLRSEIKCEQAFLAMQGDDRVQFSNDTAVAKLGFDIATGITGFWKGRLCVWGFQNVTGEIFSMRHFPL